MGQVSGVGTTQTGSSIHGRADRVMLVAVAKKQAIGGGNKQNTAYDQGYAVGTWPEYCHSRDCREYAEWISEKKDGRWTGSSGRSESLRMHVTKAVWGSRSVWDAFVFVIAVFSCLFSCYSYKLEELHTFRRASEVSACSESTSAFLFMCRD